MSKVKKVLSKKSVPSPKENLPVKAVPKVTSVPSPATDAKLAAWLKAQAQKLKSLETYGNRLKYNFVLNAKQKGDLLLKVRDRLSGIPGRFESWVREETDLGYSTALLWIDVAQNFFDVSEQFADSNPVELTLRQIRDAIRDARQKRGEGKPGAGRRKVEGEEGDAADQDDVTDSDKNRWENAAAKAEAEAAVVEGVKKTVPKPRDYRVLVKVATEGDQTNIHNALSNWSPLSTTPVGNSRSVSANVRTEDIGTALQKLGKALEGQQPKSLKVSIEL